MLAAPTWAQPVGTIAAVEGQAEIGHDGAWTPAALSAAVSVGDHLRTGDSGRMRVVFQDESVLEVGESTDMVVDQQVFDADQGTGTSLMHLLSGKIRALVSDYYKDPKASYEVETPTAVAGVRGTLFVVAYDPEQEVTEVTGIEGRVEVHSVFDRLGPGVLITANLATTVEKGEEPSPPRPVAGSIFRQEIEGFDFIGGGRPESLAGNHPLLGNATVPEPDRAPPMDTNVTGPQLHGENPDASRLIDQPPAAATGRLRVNF